MDKRGVIIESVTGSFGVRNTGDLEAATKTITATSKPGTADYSAALTLNAPSDARMAVKRIAARLNVVRDSGTSSNLYCTVSVDSADGSTNKLLDGVDVQAAALQGTNLTTGTIFDLLKDGASHTFYFFFWVDAGDSVISLVQLWECVGTYGSGAAVIMEITHTGLMSLSRWSDVIGSGTVTTRLYHDGETYYVLPGKTSYLPHTLSLFCCVTKLVVNYTGTVATDLNYLTNVETILRSG